MATTTGQIVAKNAAAWVGGTSLAGSLNVVTFEPTKEVAAMQVMADDWTYKVANIKDWKGKIKIIYTEVAGESFVTLWTAYESMSAVSFECHPKGSTASNWKYTGSIIITGAPVELDRGGGVVTAECPFEGSGAITRGTVS